MSTKPREERCHLEGQDQDRDDRGISTLGRWVPGPEELEEYLATDENTEKARPRASMEPEGKMSPAGPAESLVAMNHVMIC